MPTIECLSPKGMCCVNLGGEKNYVRNVGFAYYRVHFYLLLIFFNNQLLETQLTFPLIKIM